MAKNPAPILREDVKTMADDALYAILSKKGDDILSSYYSSAGAAVEQPKRGVLNRMNIFKSGDTIQAYGDLREDISDFTSSHPYVAALAKHYDTTLESNGVNRGDKIGKFLLYAVYTCPESDNKKKLAYHEKSLAKQIDLVVEQNSYSDKSEGNFITRKLKNMHRNQIIAHNKEFDGRCDQLADSGTAANNIVKSKIITSGKEKEKGKLVIKANDDAWNKRSKEERREYKAAKHQSGRGHCPPRAVKPEAEKDKKGGIANKAKRVAKVVLSIMVIGSIACGFAAAGLTLGSVPAALALGAAGVVVGKALMTYGPRLVKGAARAIGGRLSSKDAQSASKSYSPDLYYKKEMSVEAKISTPETGARVFDSGELKHSGNTASIVSHEGGRINAAGSFVSTEIEREVASASRSHSNIR